MISSETINSILNYATTNISPNIIGYIIGGSYQSNSIDALSDVDLIIYTEKLNYNIEGIYQVYDHNNHVMIDVIFEDLQTLTSKNLFDIYGYQGQNYYAIATTSTTDIFKLQIGLSNSWQQAQQIIKQYKNFWIHCILKGYITVVNNFIKSDEINMSKEDTKKIAYLCNVYNKEFEALYSPETLIKIKRNKLTELSTDTIDSIKKTLTKLISTYFIYDLNAEFDIFAEVKKELAKVWK